MTKGTIAPLLAAVIATAALAPADAVAQQVPQARGSEPGYWWGPDPYPDDPVTMRSSLFTLEQYLQNERRRAYEQGRLEREQDRRQARRLVREARRALEQGGQLEEARRTLNEAELALQGTDLEEVEWALEDAELMLRQDDAQGAREALRRARQALGGPQPQSEQQQ